MFNLKRCSEAIAVGSLAFAETIKGELDSKAMHREVEQFEETHVLREESEVYGFKSAVFWNESFEDAQDIGWSDPATNLPHGQQKS